MASANWDCSDVYDDNYDPDAFHGPVPRGYVRLYHYTDERGADGILRTLKIRKSRKHKGTDRKKKYMPTDAFFGEGTYLTDKAPVHHTKLEIAKDIWVNRDQFHDRMVEEGRTDFVFAVVMKRRAVQEKVQ